MPTESAHSERRGRSNPTHPLPVEQRLAEGGNVGEAGRRVEGQGLVDGGRQFLRHVRLALPDRDRVVAQDGGDRPGRVGRQVVRRLAGEQVVEGGGGRVLVG